MLRWLRMVCFGCLVLSPGQGSAQATVSDLPKVDPRKMWRNMTHDPATTTSQCIGNPITALCAVETIRACIVRADNEMCKEKEGVIGRGIHGHRTPTPSIWEKYHVTGARLLKDKDIPLGQRGDEPWAVHPGDAQIDIIDRSCYPGIGCSKEIRGELPITYTVRKIENKWVVIDWDTPRW